MLYKKDFNYPILLNKLAFFRPIKESILLNEAETWTMKWERFNGTNTKLLMRVKNIFWQDHQTKEQIYGDIPPTSTIYSSLHGEGHILQVISLESKID